MFCPHRALFGCILFVLFGGIAVQPGTVEAQSGEPMIAETERRDSLDARLEDRLRDLYEQVEAFRGIEVSVRKGVVHLEGTVVQAQQAAEAEELAQKFEGTLYVANNVRAETDLADRVSPAVSRLRTFGTSFLEFLPVGILALFVVLVTIAGTRWIGAWDAPPRLDVSPLVWGVSQRAVQAVIGLIGFVVTFDLLGVTSLVGALLGTAGVAGLALGFAFRDIIENYLAGVLLSLRQPFRVNDVVSVTDHEGRVVRLTARELVLLTFDGNHVRLPNSTVFKNVLVNYTQNSERLFYFSVGVGSDEDLSEVQEVGVDTLDAMSGVLVEPPPFARIRELGDSSTIVRFHGWVDQEETDFHKVESEAVRLVKQAFDEADIEMPEPTYRLQLFDAGDAPTPAPKGSTSPIVEQAKAIDVTRDRRLERRVEEDLRTSDEPNLLSG